MASSWKEKAWAYRNHVFNVTVYPVLGTPEPGVWCQQCLLPSAFEADVYGLGESAGGQLYATGRIARVHACVDCGETTLVR